MGVGFQERSIRWLGGVLPQGLKAVVILLFCAGDKSPALPDKSPAYRTNYPLKDGLGNG